MGKLGRMLRNSAALALLLFGAAGCQTWVPEVGLTLPSPNYLLHPPQYIPPSPPFPLTKELAAMQEAAERQASPAPGGVGP